MYQFFLFFSLLYIPLFSSPFVEKYVKGSFEQKQAFIEQLSPSQQIGQLVMGVVYGKTVDEKIAHYLHESKVGNIILFNFSNDLQQKEQVKKLCIGLRKSIEGVSGIPPLIGIDQEGGVVQRLKGDFFPSFPGNMALAATNDPQLARRVGYFIGFSLRDLGINLNFSPVVDINSNPKNPVIGVRSFGDNKKVVTLFGGQVLKGLQEGGVIGVLKHFPGHGEAASDSHTGKVAVYKSLKELQDQELYPFTHLAEHAKGVMTAHVLYPQIDDKLATLSKKCLSHLLKKEIGYKGLVISDSLSMNGIIGKCSSFKEAQQKLAEQAFEALKAGVDLLLIGKLEWQDWEASEDDNQQLAAACIAFIEKKLYSGELDPSRLREAVTKVLDTKAGIIKPCKTLPKEEGIALSKEVYKKSLTFASPYSLFETIFQENPKNYLVLCHPLIKEKLRPLIAKLGSSSSLYVLSKEPWHLQWPTINKLASQYSKVVLIGGLRNDKYVFQDLLPLLSGSFSSKLILAGLDYPYDFQRLAHPLFITYSQDSQSLENLFLHLQLALAPSGQLPIKIP